MGYLLTSDNDPIRNISSLPATPPSPLAGNDSMSCFEITEDDGYFLQYKPVQQSDCHTCEGQQQQQQQHQQQLLLDLSRKNVLNEVRRTRPSGKKVYGRTWYQRLSCHNK